MTLGRFRRRRGRALLTILAGALALSLPGGDATGGEPRIKILFDAAGAGDLRRVRTLLSMGFEADWTGNMSWTALHSAAKEGQAAVASFLIKKGAKVDAKESHGYRTPLHLAIAEGHGSLARLLLQAGADIEAETGIELHPLHIAADKDHLEIARMLVQRGANVDATDQIGRTPTHFAAGAGHVEMLELLVDQDANFNLLTPAFKESALYYALLGEHREAAALLKEHGAVCRGVRMWICEVK